MASSLLLLLLSLLYRQPNLCDSIYAEGGALLRLIEDAPFPNGRDGGGALAEAECADGRQAGALNIGIANSRRLLQLVGKEIGRYHKHEKLHATAPVSLPSTSLLPRKLRFPFLPMPPSSLSNSSVVFQSPGLSLLSTTSSPPPSNDLITHALPASMLNGTPSSSPQFSGSKLMRQLNALVSNPSSPEGSVSLLGTTPLSKHPSWVLYTSIAGGVSCLLVVSSIYIFFCRANKLVTVIPLSMGLSGQLQKALVTGVPSLGRPELERACEDFSNVIGTLSECVFYKGTLSTGVEIAVASTMITSSSDWSKQFEAQFRKKISVLSKLNHKNFMNLLGFCEGEEPFTRMMVFEYAPNGTLFEHLHIREAEHLDWAMRLRIAMGIAYCLEHMHQLNPPVVLRNLHSSTVYLTDDYAAMVSDIGFFNDGTEFGTLDGRSGLTDASLPALESDVYKFGIIMLEIISGKRPFSEDDGLLVLWASSYLTGRRPLMDMVDPTLESFSEEDVRLLCEVIRPCINPDPRERPTMPEIVGRLRRITSMLPDGATPKPSPLWWAELEILSTEVA